MDLSIIICTHNRKELLKLTLESLSNLVSCNDFSYEIIVIANACDDGTSELIDEFSRVRCVNEPNLGLGHARNRGIIEARGSNVAFLDDDIKVHADWVSKVSYALKEYSADCVAGRVVLWWDAVAKPSWYDQRHAWALSEFDRGDDFFVQETLEGIGANMVFSRSALHRIGMFNAELDRRGRTLAAGGDTEYFQRAMRLGLRSVYAPASVAHWVKPDRLRMTSFFRLGYNQGYALVRIKPMMSYAKTIRSLCGYGFLAVIHLIPLVISIILGSKGNARHHIARAACGCGGVIAWVARLTSNRSADLKIRSQI